MPVLRDMLFVYSKTLSKRKEVILNEIIKDSDVEDKVSIIEEIFGVKNLI